MGRPRGPFRRAFRYANAALNAYNVGKDMYNTYTSLRRVQRGRMSSRTATTKRRGQSGNFVTNQFDVKRIYRRRRMPRRKRVRWVRFKKRVDAVQFSGLGMTSIVFNDSDVIATTSPNQNMGTICLYGLTGASGTDTPSQILGQNDLAKIASAGSYSADEKLMFRSGVLDVTARNQSESGGQIECDVYEYVWRRKSQMASGKAALVAGFTASGVYGLTPPLAITTRGTTPFQNSEAMSYMKILKKTKFFLGENQTFTYQIRSPQNWVFDCGDISVVGQLVEQQLGRTRGLLFVVKGVPTVNSAAPSVELALGVTRTYEFKVEGETANRTGFIP